MHLIFLIQVVLSATLSHLSPLQLGFERFQYISSTLAKLNFVCLDQSKPFNVLSY